MKTDMKLNEQPIGELQVLLRLEIRRIIHHSGRWAFIIAIYLPSLLWEIRN